MKYLFFFTCSSLHPAVQRDNYQAKNKGVFNYKFYCVRVLGKTDWAQKRCNFCETNPVDNGYFPVRNLYENRLNGE